MRRTGGVGVLAALVLLATACGGGEEPPAESRRIEIEMTDNEFEPATIRVGAGERVTFVFVNNGDVVHEAFVGTAPEQEEHEREMSTDSDMTGMEGMEGMDESGGHVASVVEPGLTDELTYTFEDPAEFLIGCHQPGHYEAGMRVSIEAA